MPYLLDLILVNGVKKFHFIQRVYETHLELNVLYECIENKKLTVTILTYTNLQV